MKKYTMTKNLRRSLAAALMTLSRSTAFRLKLADSSDPQTQASLEGKATDNACAENMRVQRWPGVSSSTRLKVDDAPARAAVNLMNSSIIAPKLKRLMKPVRVPDTVGREDIRGTPYFYGETPC